MEKRPDIGTIIEFSHPRKAEIEELLITDDRLREVEDALKQFIKLASPHPHSKTSNLNAFCSQPLLLRYCDLFKVLFFGAPKEVTN